MLIKYTHRVPDRRHASQISPGFCEEKTHSVSLFSVILHSCVTLRAHRLSQCKQTQKSMIYLNLEKFIKNSKIVLLCRWQWMKINCAGSRQALTTTKADKWAAGIYGWFIPPAWLFPFYMKAPEASENPCHHSKNTITLCAAAARLGHFFDMPDVEEGFDPLCTCYYLSPHDAGTAHRLLEIRLAFLH